MPLNSTKLKATQTPQWEQPISVAVTQETLSKLEEQSGAPCNVFRKISMDVMTYAFLQESWERIELGKDHGFFPIQFWSAAQHVPVNYTCFLPSPELEQNVYAKSVQIMEDFRSAEEVHAPKAWQLCRLWALARDMQVAAGVAADDGVGGATAALAKVVWSASSDYVDPCTRCINKCMVADALRLRERAVAAGLEDLLEELELTLALSRRSRT